MVKVQKFGFLLADISTSKKSDGSVCSEQQSWVFVWDTISEDKHKSGKGGEAGEKNAYCEDSVRKNKGLVK